MTIIGAVVHTRPPVAWCLWLCLLVSGGAARAPGAAGRSPLVNVQLLAFNDFHGTLDPPAGSNRRIGEVDAGGVEFLAAHLARLVDGVKVGFIGLALRDTRAIVPRAMLRGVTFRPEVDAGNEAAAALVSQGVKAIAS